MATVEALDLSVFYEQDETAWLEVMSALAANPCIDCQNKCLRKIKICEKTHSSQYCFDKYGEAYNRWWSPDIRLKDMDRYGWDIQVILSTNGNRIMEAALKDDFFCPINLGVRSLREHGQEKQARE